MGGARDAWGGWPFCHRGPQRAKGIRKESCAPVRAQTPGTPCKAACGGMGRVQLISARAPHERGWDFGITSPKPAASAGSDQGADAKPRVAAAPGHHPNSSYRPKLAPPTQKTVLSLQTEPCPCSADAHISIANLQLGSCLPAPARHSHPCSGVSTFLTPHYPFYNIFFMESDGPTHVMKKGAQCRLEGVGGDPAWAHFRCHQLSGEPWSAAPGC